MTARFIVADVFDGLASLETGSVDVVITSPPFLALRSYLPADHELKGKEIGSEATPAEFIDTLLQVTAELRRVLAPHGSICVELGDTYAGDSPSKKGWVGEQQRLTDDRKRTFRSAPSDGYAGGGPGWPLGKSRTLIPSLYQIALAYGFNPLTGSESPAGQWRIRNVVTWARPNPPVGALGDKWRPATSDLVIACTSGKRYWDDLATRRPFSENTNQSAVVNTAGAQARAEQGGRPRIGPQINTHSGAPLLDYWVIPPGGYAGSHYAVFPEELVVPCVQAMCPFKVCTVCGLALGLERGSNGLQGVRPTGRQRVGEDLLLSRLSESTYGSEPGFDQRLHPISQGLHPDPSPEASDGFQGGLRDGASSSDGRSDRARPGTLGSRTSQERDQGRQSDRELGTADQDGTRPFAEASAEAAPVSSLRRVDSNVSECPACGGPLRNGTVLDPFAGSGTTLVVATGHGHDAIGIDLDSRNAELARDRVGPFLFDMVDLEQTSA